MKALLGLDFVRGSGRVPLEKTARSWRRWAERKAVKKSWEDGYQWNAVCSFIEHRGVMRISFGGQPDIF